MFYKKPRSAIPDMRHQRRKPRIFRGFEWITRNSVQAGLTAAGFSALLYAGQDFAE